MTEQQLTGLGFTFEKEYRHDGLITRRFAKEPLEVEYTYLQEGFPDYSELVGVSLFMRKINLYIDEKSLSIIETLSRILTSETH